MECICPSLICILLISNKVILNVSLSLFVFCFELILRYTFISHPALRLGLSAERSTHWSRKLINWQKSYLWSLITFLFHWCWNFIKRREMMPPRRYLWIATAICHIMRWFLIKKKCTNYDESPQDMANWYLDPHLAESNIFVMALFLYIWASLG